MAGTTQHPPWFWDGLNQYWNWPPKWLSQPELPGGLGAQSMRSLLEEEEIEDNRTAGVAFLFPYASYPYDFPTGSEIPLLVEASSDDQVEVHLFYTDDNLTYIGQMDQIEGSTQWLLY